MQAIRLFAPGVKAAACPVLAKGGFIGPPEWQSDGSTDEKTYYRFMADDDFAKLAVIYYCLDSAT
jgi:hypothetical protein